MWKTIENIICYCLLISFICADQYLRFTGYAFEPWQNKVHIVLYFLIGLTAVIDVNYYFYKKRKTNNEEEVLDNGEGN